MRVTNIDSLSAYFDRLISEKIKLYFFEKDGKTDEALHQEAVVKEIRTKLVGNSKSPRRINGNVHDLAIVSRSTKGP